MLRVVQVIRQQRCNGHCLSDCPARQLKQQLPRNAQVAGQWRGDTALTLPLFWRRSTVSPVFFGRYPRSSLHSVVPSPLSPSLISHLASVDVKQNGPITDKDTERNHTYLNQNPGTFTARATDQYRYPQDSNTEQPRYKYQNPATSTAMTTAFTPVPNIPLRLVPNTTE